MKKKLTHRQQQFLENFLALHQETQQPVHYARVAERLGVGKVTAYEMLRLLEQYGLVRAEYQANPDQHGPGRAAVVFAPTPEAGSRAEVPPAGAAGMEDWQEVREQILEELHESKAAGYEELLKKLLARIPRRRSPLVFASELITSLILTLSTIRDVPEVAAILQRLRRIGYPHEIGLSVMSGIGVLLSVWQRTNRRTQEILAAQINRYEEALVQLSEESRAQLGEFTRQVVRILLG